MGIKSKIKGSYAYTQWKLGKYTKRRVKNSCSPEWVIERQQYERDRVDNYSENFYHNRELDTTYKMPPIKNNVVYQEPREDPGKNIYIIILINKKKKKKKKKKIKKKKI